MKLKLLEQISFNFEKGYISSKFDINKLLIVFNDYGEALKIIHYDFNKKNILLKEFKRKNTSKPYILSNFSVFIDDSYDLINDFCYVDEESKYLTNIENLIIINPETLESKKIIPIDSNLEYSSFYKTGYEDYFVMFSNNKNDKKRYILDIKDNKLIDTFETLEKKNLSFLYTKKKEKLYGLPYTSKESICYINNLGEERYYSSKEYDVFPFCLSISDKFIISEGEPSYEWDGYDYLENLSNITVWDKKTGEIINTYKGEVTSSFYSADSIYYFEKFNCLLLIASFSNLSIIDLSKKEIVFDGLVDALYVDEENNKFGFINIDSKSYEIFELVEE